MISVIMPYWRRQQHLENAEQMYARLYGGLFDYELIVVDDGSPEPASVTLKNSRVIRLPDKDVPKNPCVPINRGVAESSGDIVVLTNPEITHITPALAQLIDVYNRRQSLYTHVGATVWSTDRNGWLVHPKYKTGHGWVPQGAALNHMVLMSRHLWDACGGFDERYRPHPGWDDNDFLFRCESAGAEFVTATEAVVGHSTTPSGWKGHAHNQCLFEETWSHRLESVA